MATGVPPFGSVSGGSGGPDIVNLGNLNAHFAIPVVNKAGRGMPFVYALTYDNSIWYPDNRNWRPVANYGWNVQTSAAVGYVQEKIFNGSCRYWNGFQIVTVNFTIYAYFGYVDDKGTTHAYSNLWTTNNSGPCRPHADWLGSSRLSSTTGRGVYGDIAYAPFGETYDGYGTTDAAFTGENQDTLTGQSGLYDFLLREYRPVQSRRLKYVLKSSSLLSRSAVVQNNMRSKLIQILASNRAS